MTTPSWLSTLQWIKRPKPWSAKPFQPVRMIQRTFFRVVFGTLADGESGTQQQDSDDDAPKDALFKHGSPLRNNLYGSPYLKNSVYR
jgi:hypothetical protein